MLSLILTYAGAFVVRRDGSARTTVSSPLHHDVSRHTNPKLARLEATPQVDEEVTLVDEDAPAGVEGAEFFGGNTRKAEFYDPVAESNLETIPTIAFERFADDAIGRQIQQAVNTNDESIYAPRVKWDTEAIWKENGCLNPIAAMKASQDFFSDMRLAIVSIEKENNINGSNTYSVRWELAVVWPAFWGPPAVLTGFSQCTLNEQGKITRQVDTLDDTNKDLILSTVRQLLPRFWDVYHIGMTPVSEYRLAEAPAAPFKSYSIQNTPPRWVRCVTIRDTSDRSDNAAAHLPNEAFTSYLKTIGPLKEDYRTVTGIAVELAAVQGGGVDITWKIPLSVGYASNLAWDVVADASVNDSYELQPARTYAVVDYNGSGPQDVTVSAVRQNLFEAVVANGLKPANGEGGRPLFGFLEKTVKACYKDHGGLSMAVYEWRPRWTNPYQIYLELETSR